MIPLYFSIIKNLFISKIKNQPYKISLIVTKKCNSRCVTCNIWKNYKDNPKKEENNLKLHEFKKIFKNLPSNVFWLAISGGEPFLRDDLYEIIIAAIENMPSLKVINITSNGFEKNKIEELAKKIIKIKNVLFYISFSIDGPLEIHNKIRNVKNAYQRTISTYNSVKEITSLRKNIYVTLTTTISKENINFLYDYFHKNFKKSGSKQDFLITLYHSGYLYENTNPNNLSIPSSNQVKKLVNLFNKNIKPFTPFNLIQKSYLKKIPYFFENPKKQTIPCFAFRDSFTLSENGEIITCMTWGKKLHNIRDINYNIKTIWNSLEHKKIVTLIKKGKCSNCWLPCEAYYSIISSWLPFIKN